MHASGLCEETLSNRHLVPAHGDARNKTEGRKGLRVDEGDDDSLDLLPLERWTLSD